LELVLQRGLFQFHLGLTTEALRHARLELSIAIKERLHLSLGLRLCIDLRLRGGCLQQTHLSSERGDLLRKGTIFACEGLIVLHELAHFFERVIQLLLD
jgi:hypothetical protein